MTSPLPGADVATRRRGRSLALLGWALTAGLPGHLAAQTAPAGKAVYDKWCAGCHGDTGAGDGDAAAFMLPRPRDFTRGVYQIRTTASGELPTDADIRHVVNEGMPGTAMPGWRTRLSEQERAEVATYIKSFSRFFAAGPAPTPLPFGSAPGESAAGIEEGREVFRKLECFKCHGDAGRGDGPSAASLTDDWDHPVRAADLTRSWVFNGGATAEQIYARLRTGLDGTPMPSFSDAVDAKVITDEQLWRVAQYVRSLSPRQPPEVREVIVARLLPAGIPAGPGDSLWTGIAPAYIPLVGQIIQKPRWFLPMVDGVWVQAAHDGSRLALRLTWNDPSQSPDSSWAEWFTRVVRTAPEVDGPPPSSQGPDRFLVQFSPRDDDGGGERPFFLGGSTRRPVALWRWRSDSNRVEEGAGTGLGRFAPRPGAGQLTHEVRFDHGQWQLVLVRPLTAQDTTAGPTFIAGRSVPIGFLAADGSNGEDEQRGAVSAWYGLHLEVPTPVTVYVQPILAGLLTAGLGVFVVFRAQRRGPRASGSNREG